VNYRGKGGKIMKVMLEEGVWLSDVLEKARIEQKAMKIVMLKHDFVRGIK
jgi:hypothetical protein